MLHGDGNLISPAYDHHATNKICFLQKYLGPKRLIEPHVATCQKQYTCTWVDEAPVAHLFQHAPTTHFVLHRRACALCAATFSRFAEPMATTDAYRDTVHVGRNTGQVHVLKAAECLSATRGTAAMPLALGKLNQHKTGISGHQHALLTPRAELIFLFLPKPLC